MFVFISHQAKAAIGDWKAYMAYHDVQEVEQAGNLIFVQASNSLYVYNKNDQSIQTFSKTDYLSDCDIQHIGYNNSAKRLLILYNNSNIDLMSVSNFESKIVSVTDLSICYVYFNNTETIAHVGVFAIHIDVVYGFITYSWGGVVIRKIGYLKVTDTH